jgi:hypothetical protein
MIVFETKNGTCRPRILCDACNKPITDIHMAMVVYEQATPDEDNTLAEIRHCHKDEVCQGKTRKLLGHSGWIGPWQEMSAHLIMLAADMSLYPKEIAEYYEDLRERGMVPDPPK